MYNGRGRIRDKTAIGLKKSAVKCSATGLHHCESKFMEYDKTDTKLLTLLERSYIE